MKISEVKISNYRSILKSEAILLDDYSVFVGKNNEGKTNILSAINMAFTTMAEWTFSSADGILSRSRTSYRRIYNYEIDYPIDLQNQREKCNSDNPTTVSMTFILNESEKRDFYRATRLKYKAPIDVHLEFFPTKAVISVLRRRDDELKSKTRKIIQYIVKTFDVVYIPAIRTSEQSLRIIEQIVYNGLNSLRQDSEYQKAYELMRSREQERLKEISSNLKPTMQQFVPSINDIRLVYDDRSYMRMMRGDVDFVIDDGNITNLEHKGDGIKSLIQIALLKESSDASTGLILIEEPESHLHSGAIHELYKGLQDISKKQQMVVSTHNPIFINKNHVECNYIVDGRICSAAHSIKEIRDVLGVCFSDSLVTSDYVIVVEGESDRIVYSHLLSLASSDFKNLINSGTISFLETRGATKASSFLTFMDQLVIHYFAIWDNDEEGISALEKCQKSSLIDKNYRIIPPLGKKEAVLEDLINQKITIGYINKKYGCNIPFNTGKTKWSDYVLKKLKNLGLQVDSDALEKDKNAIAAIVTKTNDFKEIVNVEAYRTFLTELASTILKSFKLM